jgi:hypothetical protein
MPLSITMKRLPPLMLFLPLGFARTAAHLPTPNAKVAALEDERQWDSRKLPDRAKFNVYRPDRLPAIETGRTSIGMKKRKLSP